MEMLDGLTQQAIVEYAAEACADVSAGATRPSVLYRPRIFRDGDRWCALYGENIQDGVTGFGDSPEEAMADFDASWSRALGATAGAAAGGGCAFDFAAHLARQREWSECTFGPGERSKGVVDHIRKELDEILGAPDDLSEWIDVVILALDGAWRMGASPEQIIAALVAKQTKNEGRVWPDWRTAAPGKAIEHVRREAPDGE